MVEHCNKLAVVDFGRGSIACNYLEFADRHILGCWLFEEGDNFELGMAINP